jgi:hypothetical protein
MHISYVNSQLNGFKKWSDAHPAASNDDDHPPEVTAVAVAVPRFKEAQVVPERLLSPWFVPGVGVSL